MQLKLLKLQKYLEKKYSRELLRMTCCDEFQFHFDQPVLLVRSSSDIEANRSFNVSNQKKD